MRFFLTLIALFISAAPAQAAESFSYSAFEQIPVLDQGRIKPLGAYARLRLKNFSGKENIDGQSAAAWLAETLFDPSQAIERKIFRIDSGDLKTRLGLPLDTDRFNLPDLQTGLEQTRGEIPALLQKPEGELTKTQQDLLALHEKALSYGQILRSFSMILPLNIEIPEKYKAPIPSEKYKAPIPSENKATPNGGGSHYVNNINFLDIQKAEKKILRDLKSIIEAKGQNPDRYTDEEKHIARLAFQIQQIRNGSQNGNKTNSEFRILDNVILENSTALLSPWEMTKLVHLSGPIANHTQLKEWLKLANFYRDGNAEGWKSQTKTIKDANTSASTARLKTELLYYKSKPYTISMALYALSILLGVFALSKPSKLLNLLTLSVGAAALTCHIAAIAARIFILARPPVGTLYESVLFVSAICAAAALILSFKNKDLTTGIVGQAAALGLLLIAPIMLQSGDSLELLVAVLNTNFWLATHVICITAGYGVCILAACSAHTYLIARTLGKPQESLNKIYTITYKTSLAALLLTAVGTVLGGIWADQSWGRFWGWDPKENGALLIVLWLIWTLHARLSNHMKSLSFMASTAFLNVITAISWFGVNLLGVGLHSYGFTSGLASGLAAFCIIEAIVIAGLFITARTKEGAIKP